MVIWLMNAAGLSPRAQVDAAPSRSGVGSGLPVCHLNSTPLLLLVLTPADIPGPAMGYIQRSTLVAPCSEYLACVSFGDIYLDLTCLHVYVCTHSPRVSNNRGVPLAFFVAMRCYLGSK